MATTLEPVSTRITSEERETFRKTCESVGTTPSGALRIFVTCFNNYGGFPFVVRNNVSPAAAPQKAEPFETEEEAMEFITAISDRMLNEAW